MTGGNRTEWTCSIHTFIHDFAAKWSVPSPSGYDTHYSVETPRRDALLSVGIDTTAGTVDRFLVQLHYTRCFHPRRAAAISRIDHNPASRFGHDLYNEGLHVDVVLPDGSEAKLWPPHPPPPADCGSLIAACIEYYRSNVDYFVKVYEGAEQPGDPPGWP